MTCQSARRARPVVFERDSPYQKACRTEANALLQTLRYDLDIHIDEQQLGVIARVSWKRPHVYAAQPNVQIGVQVEILRRYRYRYRYRYNYDQSGQLISV